MLQSAIEGNGASVYLKWSVLWFCSLENVFKSLTNQFEENMQPCHFYAT